ncbi:hypothetical protein BOSE62_110211 [Bosea sp. 62]|nr:hypothetical protein BOSE21B_50389 [Bosea sp. 21B]CAD5289416.1 hypothetical protein BOSE46_70370 [Bosea sp. 46]CAD5301172.1 hypothetical protein BOSE7B_90305 [Bosea sp. 7B]VVT60513.1 hypothetical protein BOS5A_211304 [Bosea sp. EC-HK365B]VXB03116.1 hypothetical protein BOSE62_110211 [Bosea sp. 62]VXB64577.1 hypothetical protein BOSE127_140245 [Bosea sp. 127]VXC61331.1 hypothetical protein BOSE29B_50370 [Bosea sp. 29B]VXC93188.1 hypothetical protein BOSE125_70434 [Bosea sp. 125]
MVTSIFSFRNLIFICVYQYDGIKLKAGHVFWGTQNGTLS